MIKLKIVKTVTKSVNRPIKKYKRSRPLQNEVLLRQEVHSSFLLCICAFDQMRVYCDRQRVKRAAMFLRTYKFVSEIETHFQKW